ncbi:MAG: hypothetical protein ACYC1M_13745 [Armatimonadota bacterium]
MSDPIDGQNEQLLDEYTEEFTEDPENPSTLICTYCGEENDPVDLKGKQLNRCWKCGHYVDFCDYVAPYDIKVGGSSRNPTGVRKWVVTALRLWLIWGIIGTTVHLFNIVNEMRTMPLK